MYPRLYNTSDPAVVTVYRLISQHGALHNRTLDLSGLGCWHVFHERCVAIWSLLSYNLPYIWKK